ncbi:unnamed protein product [Gordionus sp. m RMFG-2023]
MDIPSLPSPPNIKYNTPNKYMPDHAHGKYKAPKTNPQIAPPQIISPVELDKGSSEDKKKVKKKKRQPKSNTSGEEYESNDANKGKSDSTKDKKKESGKEKSRKIEAKSQRKGLGGKSKRTKGEKSLATKSVKSKRGKTKLMIDGQSIHPPPQRGAIPMPGIGGRAQAPAALKAKLKPRTPQETPP